MEEELAEAIDKDFYESYKTWTLDNQNASSSQKVWVQDKDSSVGKELESSSWGESNTTGSCRGHQQEETSGCNSSKRQNDEGVQCLIRVALCHIHSNESCLNEELNSWPHIVCFRDCL